MTNTSVPLPLLVALVVAVVHHCFADANERQVGAWRLTSPEGSYVRAVAGFGTELECYVESCLPKELSVKWYKDGKLVADGTHVVGFDGRGYVRHGITLDHTKDCNGTCSSIGPFCPHGYYCLDNSCCACDNEEYTLILSNLTYDDAGTYVCKVEGGNGLEFDLEILEYGLMPSRRTYTFDHSACCAAEGVSPKCMPLCKPSTIEQHKFDPVACEDEYEKLLKCVTEGGNVSHVHCCRINFVPAFCWEFCHGEFSEPKRSNQFCIYWMPEIFDCYERAYLPFPGPPEKLVVNPLNSSALLACWQPPKIRVDTVLYYTVRYQEVPRFPFLGGGIPFLTGEGEDVDGSAVATVDNNPFRTSGITEEFPSHAMPHERRKRQSLLIMTHNLLTNETDVREYKFSEVNTTDTCVVIDNLKASTQYLVFATAVNSYGTSLPTSKQTASTEAIIYPNNTLPDVLGCCKRNLVSPECVSKLCDLNDVPSAFGAFSVALTCRSEFAQVAPCLADGRNHSACCKARGVGGECLKLCDGTASDLGLTSVLCLSLDMHAVYSCLREGYGTLNQFLSEYPEFGVCTGSADPVCSGAEGAAGSVQATSNWNAFPTSSFSASYQSSTTSCMVKMKALRLEDTPETDAPSSSRRAADSGLDHRRAKGATCRLSKNALSTPAVGLVMPGSSCALSTFHSGRTAASLDYKVDNSGHFPVEIIPFLYLGNASNAADMDILVKYNIKYIVNVTRNLPNAFEHDNRLKYLQIPIDDNWSQNLAAHFPQAIHFIDEARSKKCGVLVHCLAGISRSVTVTVAYLMHTLALSLDDAYDLVKRHKPNISPNFDFLGQLVEFERHTVAARSGSVNQQEQSNSTAVKETVTTTTTTSTATVEDRQIGTFHHSVLTVGTSS